LEQEPDDARQLKAMLAPYPPEKMTCWPVNARVGNLKNSDPSLIDPIAIAKGDVGRLERYGRV